MQLTKERRIYVSVLGLGLAALGVDRFVLNSGTTRPSIAAAQSVDPQSLVVKNAPAPLVQVTTVAQQLDAVSAPPSGEPDAAAHPDAFKIITRWYRDAGQGSPDIALVNDTALHLTGVITDRAGAPVLAVVNGKRIRVGDTVAGIKLTEARGADRDSPATATVEYQGKSIELRLATPAEKSEKSR